MKILLLSLNWVEYQIEMANALTALGHRVEVIFKTERVHATVGEALPQLLDRRVRYHLLDDRPRGLRDPRQLSTIARLIVLLRGISPDVIFLHEATNTYLPLCLSAAARRTPLLLTVHDVTAHPGADAEGPRRREWVQQWLRQRASAVIVHGEWLRQRYLELPGKTCRNVHAIPHGCYTVLRHWAAADAQEIENSVLFFGRIHAYKGLGYLVRAADRIAASIPNLRVVIAGDGTELDLYRDRFAAHPERFVIHRGYLPNTAVARVFQESSLVVLPYIEGSQSGVVRIAYVFGKPVVATRVGSIPESIREGETGLLVPPRDENALADAVVAVLADKDRLRRMAGNAARMPETEMSWSRVAERTVRVIEDLPRRAALPVAVPGGAA